jgi:hypothetical protein
MNDFVTIAIFDDYITANFEKQKLEENEVPCYLADENTITAKWILKNALGGIKLRVPNDYVEQAEKILAERIEAVQIDHTIDSIHNDLICPQCGSNNTRTEKFSKSSIGWTWLLLGFPISINIIRQSRCFYCENKWDS